jgi:type I restriction enzyme S subunit
LDLSKFRQHILQENDLVITRSGRVGTVAVFDGFRLPVLPGAFLIRFRLKRDVAEPHFYQYFFNSPAGQELLRSVATGSVQQNLNITSLHRLYIPVPSLNEQRAIARILGSLDDKIEANRRVNETLETMVRTLFKSWFVDFDPVQARAEGRAPACMDEEMAALFPDRFEEVGFFSIPKGWKVGTVADLAIISSGKRPDNRESELSEKMKIPLYGGGGVMGYVEKPLYSEPILLTGRVGTLGKIFRITTPCWPSDNTLVVISKHCQSYEFLYFHASLIDFSSLNRGSTQPLVTQSDLQRKEIIVPSSDILEKFHKICEPFFKMIDFNNNNSIVLSNIRDGLLSSLLFSSIKRDNDVEKSMESNS